MAQRARIDSVSYDAAGAVNVTFTVGETPISATPTGNGTQFASKADLAQAINDAEAQIANFLHLVALAQWVKADANMTHPENATNKFAQIDLSGATSAFSVG